MMHGFRLQANRAHAATCLKSYETRHCCFGEITRNKNQKLQQLFAAAKKRRSKLETTPSVDALQAHPTNSLRAQFLQIPTQSCRFVWNFSFSKNATYITPKTWKMPNHANTWGLHVAVEKSGENPNHKRSTGNHAKSHKCPAVTSPTGFLEVWYPGRWTSVKLWLSFSGFNRWHILILYVCVW